MQESLRYFLILLKMRCRRVSTWLTFLGFFLLLCLFESLQLPDSNNCKVCFYCQNQELGKTFYQELCQQNSFYSFALMDSLEDLKEEVYSGRAECGFELDPEYQSRLENQKQEGIFTYYCNSFSTKGEVAKETLYAVLLKEESSLLMKEEIGSLYQGEDQELYQSFLEDKEQIQEESQLFTIVPVTVDGKNVSFTGSYSTDENQQKKNSWQQMLLLIYLFLSVYLGQAECGPGDAKGPGEVLRGSGRWAYEGANMFAAALPAFTLFVLWNWQYPILWVEVLLFGLVSVLFCFGLSKILRKEKNYRSAMPAALLLVSLLLLVWLYW